MVIFISIIGRNRQHKPFVMNFRRQLQSLFTVNVTLVLVILHIFFLNE